MRSKMKFMRLLLIFLTVTTAGLGAYVIYNDVLSAGEVTVEFNVDGGTSVSAMRVAKDGTVLHLETPKRTGHEFDGWYLDAEYTMPFNRDMPLSEDATLHAKWSPVEYMVVFDTRGGESVSPAFYRYNQTIQRPDDSIRLGYSFDGWFTDPGTTSPFAFGTMPARNLTVYARWVSLDITITFNALGGTHVNPLSAPAGSEISPPANPQRPGYTFTGWFADPGMSIPFEFDTMPGENATLFAGWDINTFTLSFITYTDETIGPETLNFNAYMSAPPPQKLDYHTFGGWFLNAGFTVPFQPGMRITADTTLHARWDIERRTIRFEGRGGTEPEPIAVDIGESIDVGMLPQPDRTGHAFAQWFMDAALTIPFETQPMPTKDFTLYAAWDVNEYTISFDSNGGSPVPTVPYAFDAEIDAPDEPIRDGYEFMGWFTDDGVFGEAFEFTTMPAENITLYAAWTINQYTITFETYAGNDVGAMTQNYHTLVFAPANPSKNGNYFDGWYTDETFTVKYQFTTMPAEDITLYAKWMPQNFVIIIYSGHEAPPTYLSRTYGEPVDLPSLSRDGYVFADWFKDDEYIIRFTRDTMPSENLNLHAKWTPKLYTLEFNATGGSDVDSMSEFYLDPIVKPEDPTKSGHVFSQWYVDEARTIPFVFDNMPMLDIEYSGYYDFSEETLTLYADWTPEQYTISFETHGGKPIAPMTEPYATEISAPPEPSRDGHTFDGWYLDETTSSEYDFDTMPAEDITLHARWKINAYTITFDSTGGSFVKSMTRNFSEDINEPVSPTMYGHAFIGWSSDSTMMEPFAFDTMPGEDTVLYAVWDIKVTYILFESNGGSAVSAIAKYFGEDITEPTPPTKEGYTFNGWYLDDETSEEPFVFDTMPGENLTLYAKWGINPYTIALDSLGGEYVPPIEENYGTDVSAPPSPTWEGHTFLGWYTSEDFETEYIFDTMPVDGITLYANWGVNAYTLSFETGTDETIPAFDVNFGTFAASPEDPERTGYTFNGWYLDDEEPFVFDTDTMPADDLTLHANWTINQYTISFETFTGKHVDTIEENYQTIVFAPAPPSKDGSNFDGWYTNADLTGDKYQFTMMPAEDITLYAKWVPREYYLIFDTMGGEGLSPRLRFFEDPVNLPTTSKIGHTFVDWWYYDDEENQQGYQKFEYAFMPARGFTLYAKWTTNEYDMLFVSEGNQIDALVFEYLENTSPPADPSLEGYTFIGWYEDLNDPDSEHEFTQMPASDVTLYAKWELNEYTLSFHSQGGSEIPSDDIEYGADITTPEPPIKPGHAFLGWHLDLDDEEAYDFTEMPPHDLHLFAKWERSDYTITFDTSSEGSPVPSQTLPFETPIPKPMNPICEGHKFDAWYEDPACETLYVFGPMPDENITVYACWIIQTYHLAFDSQGGSPIDSIVMPYHSELPSLEEPFRLGYTFNGWYVDPRSDELFTHTTMPGQSYMLYADWLSNWITVTFETGEHGSEVPEATGFVEEPFVEPDEPTREGHAFLGWFEDPDDDEAYRFELMPLEDTTLYAKWDTLSFTLSFDTMGADPESIELTFEYGQPIVLPEDPSNLGYYLEGWYDADDVLFDLATMPATDVMLYAHWEMDYYTITFLGEDIDIDPREYLFDENISAPKTPIKEGHAFIAWFTSPDADPDVDDPFEFTTMPGYDVTLYAHWRVVQYFILFDSRGGSIVEPMIANFGTEIEAPGEPYKEGHTFEGWFVGEDEYVFDTMTTANPVLYADWTPNTYTIEFDVDGGSEPIDDIVAVYQEPIFAPVDPQKEGHTFQGWLVGEEEFSFAHHTTMPATNTEDFTWQLVADWQVNTYDINYHSNGGSPVPAVPYAFDAEIDAPDEPIRDGYEFRGWFTDDGVFGEAFEFTTMPAHDIELYAHWTPIVYEMSFESNGGTPVQSILQPTDSIITEPIEPYKYGHIFKGWFKDDITFQDGFDFENETMPSGGITLYADWDIQEYFLKYNSMGGTHIDSSIHYYNSTISAPSAPSLIGHDFAGWYLEPDCQTAFEHGTMPGKNTVLYAGWDIHEYKINFDMNLGEPDLDSITAEYNQAFSEVVDDLTDYLNPTRPYYTFVGWYRLNSEDLLDLEGTMPAHSSAGAWWYRARWEAKTYTFTFEPQNGIQPLDISKQYGEPVILPATERVGYTFMGWYDAPVGGQRIGDIGDEVGMMGTLDPSMTITLYAQWNPLYFTIDYDMDSGVNSPDNPDFYIYNDPDIKLKDPSFRPGFTFGGWYTDNSFAEQYRITMIEQGSLGSITIYARWIPNE